MTGHLPPAVDTAAANAASREELNSQTNNSLHPPTSASSLSLSPITFNSPIDSPTTRQRHMQESPQLANGFVGGASPSFFNTNFPSALPSRSTDIDHAPSASHALFPSLERPSTLQRPSSSASTSTVNSEATSPSNYTQQGVSPTAESPLAPSVTQSGNRLRKQKEKRYREDGSDEEEERATVQKPKATMPTSFIYKLYDILDDPSNRHLISFGPLEGSIEVYDIIALARDVLPRYFKHSNFASFVRQLNMWGWRKETRHGGWIFMHPIFRPGRRDLLPQIKRSDEGTKKKPDTVRPRMKANRRPPTPELDTELDLAPRPVRTLPSPPPPPSPFASSSAGQDRYPLFLDTSVPSRISSTSTTRLHPHSAPALIEPTQSQGNPSYSLPPAPHFRQLDGPFSAPPPSQPSSSLISPIFNTDGTHPRPALPPAFVDTHQLPRPVSRNVPHHVPFNTAEALVQLEEAKKRLALSTSLIEHVFQRLRIEKGHDQWLDFPFYVFDPRFSDPGFPMRRIIDEYDARRSGFSPQESQASPFHLGSYHRHLQPESFPSSMFPSSDFAQESTQPAPHLFSPGVPLDLTVPPSRHGRQDTANTNPHGSFGSSHTAISRQKPDNEALIGLGISMYNYSDNALAPTMREEIYSHQLESDRMEEEQRWRIQEEFRPVPPHHPRRSSVAPIVAGASLGPSSFSLVDFNDVRPATATVGSVSSKSQQVNIEEHPRSESTVQYQSPIEEEEPTPRHEDFAKTGNTYP